VSGATPWPAPSSLGPARGLRVADPLAVPRGQVQKDVLREVPVLGPQLPDSGACCGAELAFRVPVAPVAEVLLADPDQSGGPKTTRGKADAVRVRDLIMERLS
jgi:hypothetical protein